MPPMLEFAPHVLVRGQTVWQLSQLAKHGVVTVTAASGNRYDASVATDRDRLPTVLAAARGQNVNLKV